jgi:hypothetical protein
MTATSVSAGRRDVRKWLLAELQGQGLLVPKAAPMLGDFVRQESGNQRDSTRLNLNGDSDFRVNVLRPALV